jgi:hypothetical protein
MSACRLCRNALDGAPRMVIDPAPSGAQHFSRTPEDAVARSIELIIVECTSCGLVQSASAPVEGYRNAITAAGVSAPMRAHRLRQAQRLATEVGRAGARAALIGCGNGYELPILAEAGFSPEGVEWGGAPTGYDGRWPVHNGYPEFGNVLPGAPYDAFACYNFLEHAADPRGFLQAVAASLLDRGAGVVEVPNYARQREQGRAADYIADHLSYFDAQTFRAMLTVAGFDVAWLAEVRDGENIEAIVHRRAPSSLPLDGRRLAMAQAAVRAFFETWAAVGKPAVAWGASHQALTLFAGASQRARPRAILDSAPFKAGTFAPATGIPVVAPTPAALDGVAAVLVIAAGYEREIGRTLRDTLAFAGEVWTMRGAELHRLD